MAENNGGNSGVGVVGIVTIILILAALVYFGMRMFGGNTNSGTTVNIPEKVDINVGQ